MVVDGTVELRPGVSAQLLDRSLDDGTRTSRFTLIERRDHGAWAVRLTAHARAGAEPWVLVDVVTPDVPGQDTSGWRRVGIPAVVPALLQNAPCFDGGTPQSANPIVLDGDDVDPVIEAICDPERRGLVLVAAAPGGVALDAWSAYAKERLRDTVGVCTAYVLGDQAVAALNRSLDGHGTPPGCFRTYRPDADPASDADSRRHRIMSERTLTQRSAGYVQSVLGGAARTQVVALPLPPDVAAVDRLVARWETEALLEVPPPAPVQRGDAKPDEAGTVADQAEVFLALTDAVNAVLGDVPVDVAAVRSVTAAATRAGQLEQALERARDAIDELQDEVETTRTLERELRREIEDRELDHAIDIDRMTELDDAARHLRKELMQLGHGEAAWAEVPEEERSRAPDSMFELLERLDELPYVRFTGDREATLELDDVDPLGRSAKKAWQALLALNDYARLRVTEAYSGSVYDYCREPPGDCHGWSAERHASDESDGTKNNPKFAAARMLPVPETVDPSGRRFMWAHFKLMASGSVSPRMHYLDDTGNSGFVYVGYLGRHLPNAQTN